LEVLLHFIDEKTFRTDALKVQNIHQITKIRQVKQEKPFHHFPRVIHSTIMEIKTKIGDIGSV
jgi:hypothetical protein